MNHNPINTYLHGSRYRWLYKKLIELKLSGSINENPTFLDIGSGHSYIFEILKTIFDDFTYIAIEPDEQYAHYALDKYSSDKRFSIINDYALPYLHSCQNVDFVCSLECFEHIPEFDIISIIDALSKLSPSKLFITVPNEIGPALAIKNLGSFLLGYKRYKEYSLKESINSSLFRTLQLPPHKYFHKGFDYRWLLHSFHQKFEILSLAGNPFNFLPLVISPNIFIEMTCKVNS